MPRHKQARKTQTLPEQAHTQDTEHTTEHPIILDTFLLCLPIGLFVALWGRSGLAVFSHGVYWLNVTERCVKMLSQPLF